MIFDPNLNGGFPKTPIKKFNENHDPSNGEFSEGDGGVSGLYHNDDAGDSSYEKMTSNAMNAALKAASKAHALPTGFEAKPEPYGGQFDDRPTVSSSRGLSTGTQGSYDIEGNTIDLAESDSGTMSAVALHEYGHYLDAHSGLVPGTRNFDATSMANQPNSPLHGWYQAVHASQAYGDLREENSSYARYAATNTETFARSYAQWVGSKPGNEAMLSNVMKGDSQWKSDDFTPISAEFDKLFSTPVSKATGTVIRKARK